MRNGMVVAILLSLAASAAEAQAPGFALVTGDTVAPGADLASGKFGWPGVELGYTHGLSDRFDVGVVFDLLYSIEGTTTTQFGISMGVPLRLMAFRREKTSLQLQFTPGFTVYTTNPATFGFNFPVGATLGIQVSPELRVAVGADLMMKVAVTPEAVFIIAPMFGPALEYYVDKNFSVSIDTRFGPVVSAGNGTSFTEFGFRTQVGLAYRLP